LIESLIERLINSLIDRLIDDPIDSLIDYNSQRSMGADPGVAFCSSVNGRSQTSREKPLARKAARETGGLPSPLDFSVPQPAYGAR
jgi:hypothetical protein